ncbi:hypothetical protein A3L11_02890 [Thermococcus siculi]|uniref:Sulfotransferase domain-containing protein n=2 Tax=Thermococcus siculi TaxID=72803 RepID=A0A2Z2MKA2_9EURY|nr:hypothetical protein A3L11_02890 [Thermococcus siculi]
MGNSLPNFLVCGTMKGGTTSLYYYLREHPEIYLPTKEEIHFFDLHFGRGIGFYKKYFADVRKGHKAVGEVTPDYMYLEHIPELIHETIPDVKLIFILRNPVDRAYSHYWHAVTKWGVEYLPFERAIEAEPERISRGTAHHRYYSYLDRGKYALQLKRFRKYFDDDQMLVLITEEFKRDPVESLKRVFEFLGVDPNRYNFENLSRRHNIGYSPKIPKLHMTFNRIFGARVGPKELVLGYWYRKMLTLLRRNRKLWELFFTPGYPKLDLGTRDRLMEYFAPYNRELESLLGRKIDAWLRTKQTSQGSLSGSPG